MWETVWQSGNYFWHSEDLRTSLECVCEQVSVGLCLCAHTYMWVQIADAYIHTQSVSEIQPSISRSWYCLVFANLSQRSTFYVIFFSLWHKTALSLVNIYHILYVSPEPVLKASPWRQNRGSRKQWLFSSLSLSFSAEYGAHNYCLQCTSCHALDRYKGLWEALAYH